MTTQNILLLVILGVTLVLFSIETISIDIIALSVLVALVVTGLLPVDLAFGGFRNETIILIVGLLILTASLVRTGGVDFISKNLLQRVGSASGKIKVACLPARFGTYTLIGPEEPARIYSYPAR